METHELIDAQFDRAVEIVQGLPKTGPIQTDYEEKLQMYSLYKQATVGNVKSPRPGIWDMLGRAKWDAWAKHKDIEPYEAKWLYVEALLKVLRRYSDKTIAQTLVQELESYSGDPSNLVLSRASMQSPGSGSSGSNASQEPPYPLQRTPGQYTRDDDESSEGEGSTEGEDEDEARDLRSIGPNSGIQQSHLTPRRPLSSQRYQTPITGSLVSQQAPLGVISGGGIPSTQPLPIYETPSAFPAPSISSTPASTYHPPGSLYETSRPGVISPLQHMYGTRSQTQSLPVIPTSTLNHNLPIRPASRITLERAIENVQAHLAALTERLEILESRSSSNSNRNSIYGLTSRDISSSFSGRPDHNNNRNNKPNWDLNDLGMWSYVLNPISHTISLIHKLARFFTRDEGRSPTKVIIRRLCLDLSFLVAVVMVIGAVWRKSGVRRREVKAALGVLWRAILGTGVVVAGGHGHARRSLQDKGV